MRMIESAWDGKPDGPVADEDVADAAFRLIALAKVVAKAWDREPYVWEDSANGRGKQAPDEPKEWHNLGGYSWAFTDSMTLPEGSNAPDGPVLMMQFKGWSKEHLVEERNGMLRADAAFIEAFQQIQPNEATKASYDRLLERYTTGAKDRWAAFKAEGEIQWSGPINMNPPGFTVQLSPYGIETNEDRSRLLKLWEPFWSIEPITAEDFGAFHFKNAKAQKALARLAWLDVQGNRERDARRQADALAKWPAPTVNMAVVRYLAAEISPTDKGRPPEHVIGVPLMLAQAIMKQVSPAHMVLATQHIVAASHAEWLQGGSGELVFIPSGEKALRELGLRGADIHQILLALEAIKYAQRSDFPGFELVSNIAETEKQLNDTGRPTKGYVFSVGIPLRPVAVRWELERQKIKIPADYAWSVPLMNAMNMPTVGNPNTLSNERAFNAMHLTQFAIENRTEYADRGIKLAELIDAGAEVYGFTAAHRRKLANSLTGRLKDQSDLFAPFEIVGDDRVQFSEHYSDVHQNILSAAGHTERRKAEQKKGASPKPRKPKKPR